MKFYVTYWLKNQSKMFSRPQMVVVDTPDELRDIVLKCEKYGYEIENIVSMQKITRCFWNISGDIIQKR